VIEALRKTVDHGVFGYPWPGDSVTTAIADWVVERHGWHISPEDVFLVPGVVTGFNQAAHAVTEPGQGVLLQTPAYGPFFGVEGNVGLIQQEMVLTQDEQGVYQVDIDAFEATITPETRIFMLCNPHNPTGRVFTQSELEAMAEVCLKYNIIICSDEIHSDLLYSESNHIPIASLSPDIAEKTITLIAPSKTFNIAGLKASAAIVTDPDLRKKFQAGAKGLVGWVNMLGMVAMEAAYRQGAPWLDELMVYLQANRDFVTDYVNKNLPGITMTKPEATFLAWLDCREALADIEIEEAPDPHFNPFFMQRAGVILNDGQWFGAGGEGFARFNFGSPRAMIEEALERMKDALEAC
jgi:cystathionine beta-lyase